MRVLVVGDIIIDTYVHGTKRGLSAETPTIVADLVEKKTFVGGAGLVVRHLLRFGHEVSLVTVGYVDRALFYFGRCDPLTGSENSRLLIRSLDDGEWFVSEKERYYVEDYKLLQYDSINQKRHDIFSRESMIDILNEEIDHVDAVVVADNRHGTIDEVIAKKIVKLCKKKRLPLFVDSQVSQEGSNHEWYKGADFIFLNDKEIAEVFRKMRGEDFTGLTEQYEEIRKNLKASIVHKRGRLGSKLARDGSVFSFGPSEVVAVDTCGAGDAFLAAFVHSGGDSIVANKWAGLSTTYKGTYVPKENINAVS